MIGEEHGLGTAAQALHGPAHLRIAWGDVGQEPNATEAHDGIGGERGKHALRIEPLDRGQGDGVGRVQMDDRLRARATRLVEGAVQRQLLRGPVAGDMLVVLIQPR
jgi:hypothetical protein